MSVSKERLEEFKKIMKEDYGKDLANDEAFDAANNLVGFFDLLLKLDHKDKQKNSKSPKTDTTDASPKGKPSPESGAE
ncbi:MAG: hypothetical protein A3D65_00690 [Candidatus Lloydbacteria bacterium RIFCSPHIGHO2_02_FULL_50_13]|uniref:Uncharacterized protein n=1 Tax=Candidatus Lloydbacteria bacterium RIFCSPHIGHO2_02_FULL_50_13 TaxID=1798661 RepID=A0A1G2DBZ3_9BACT|nr:MAG: hypothetical protein A3D65_00690 [Candidatus Lloydbacteria bacterium RIFCSPHIGHO2_02_FULL_50_13]